MLAQIVKQNLSENIDLLQQLTNEELTLPFPELGNATIGEHMRHIIELLGSLIDNYEKGTINYDKRKRDIILQTNKTEAIKIHRPKVSLSLALFSLLLIIPAIWITTLLNF